MRFLNFFALLFPVLWDKDGDGGGGHGPDANNDNPQGKETPPWVAALPDGLKDDPWIKQFAKPGDFASEALRLRNESTKLIKPIDSTSTAEEVSAYKKRFGIPEKEDDLSIPDEIDGTKLDPGRVKKFKALVMEHGLTSKQADALIRYNVAEAKEFSKTTEESTKAAAIKEAETVKNNVEKADLALREQWGGQYSNRLGLAKNVFQSMPENVRNRLDALDQKTGYQASNDPELVSWLYSLAATAQPGRFVGGDRSQSKTGHREKGLLTDYDAVNRKN